VFFPKLRKFNPLYLSSGLSIAAGTIIYLAFVGLLPESGDYFVSAAAKDTSHDYAGDFSTLFSALSFFGGIAMMYASDWLVHSLSPEHSHNIPMDEGLSTENDAGSEKYAESKVFEDVELGDDDSIKHQSHDEPATESDLEEDDSLELEQSMKTRLLRTGLTTAVALSLHNIPEGITTFVASTQDPTIGAALAIGIALHNIPEGMAVALPLYFSNRKRVLAFTASLLCGLTQTLGALIAYSVLAIHNFSNTAFGVLFGVAGGMLVVIAVKTLLPAAYKYDPTNRVTTKCFVLGMVMIAVALVVLESSGGHNHGLEASDSHSNSRNDTESLGADGHHHDDDAIDHHHDERRSAL